MKPVIEQDNPINQSEMSIRTIFIMIFLKIGIDFCRTQWYNRFWSLIQFINSIRRRSSVGQSVRFTSERSWVRAPSSPPESTVILIELRWIFYVSVSLSRVFWRCFRKARFAISWIHSSFSCMSNNWSLSMVSGKRRVAVMLRELFFSTANEYSYIRQRRCR